MNNAPVIDQQASTDVRKDQPMHNVKTLTEGGSADRTTQLDPCKIELELPVEHDQNHHIGIPTSTPQIPSDSRNQFGSTDNPSSRSNQGQAPSRWTLIAYAFKGQLLPNEPYKLQSFEHAMEDISKAKWEEAMRDGYLSLIHNKT